MTTPLIQTEDAHDGQVVRLTLGPAPANILSAAAMEALSRALADAEAKPQVKLVEIAGAGKHFSFGASVEEHTADKVGAMLPGFHRLIGRLIGSPIPTLAKVSGQCLGGGFELAMACTFLFCDETAVFAVPEIELGVFPPVAAALLPLKVGPATANRLILTGERFRGEALLQSGLVCDVAPKRELDAAVDAFTTKQLLPKSASSLRIAHRAARAADSEQYGRSIRGLEALYIEELMATKDAVEGIEAFLQKRPASWSDA